MPRHSFAIGAALCAILALGAASISGKDWVVFNHSASMPRGLYVRTNEEIAQGAVVTVRARDVAPEQAHARHFEDDSDRFIKRVAAMEGDRVCGVGPTLLVDGVAVAEAQRGAEVQLGWSECRILAGDEVLLLGEGSDSFDGRYWGSTRINLVEGVWRKL